jgi:hypothetical protein
MRRIICSTTPILSLIKINKLDLLQQLYGQIIIPNAVYKEVEEGKFSNHYQDLKTINWIKIETLNKNLQLPNFGLDAGEEEVIQLALQINADFVIIDETLGRKIALQNNIRLTGTIGLLLKAKEKNLISSVRTELDLLLSEGIWISKKLYQRTLEISNEK